MVRLPARALVVLAVLLSAAAPAAAQIPATKPYSSLTLIRGVPQAERPYMPKLGDIVAPPLPAAPAAQAPRGVLPALYAGNVTLQILDAHSTLRAVDAGHVEGNPIMRWTTSHPAAFVSLKAAAAAGTIFVAEKIRKKHPRRAVLFMVGINAAYALIVAHNYRVPTR